MNISIKNCFNLYFLIIITLAIRIIAVYYIGDEKLEHEWLILFRNLYNHGVLSLRSFDGNFIPSVFMPPESIELAKIILTSQIILSTAAIFLFYKLNNFFFSKNWSIFNSFLLSIFPLNIYSTTQISSISLQIFLLISYLYLFFLLKKYEKFLWIKIFCFAIVSGLLMLLRGEFYLVFVISLFYLLILKKLQIEKIIIILILSLIVISPYLVRNYFTFNKITLTKSIGYNLWKGNNPIATVEGVESPNAYT